MDFQKFVDGFDTMTCVMSVEDLGRGKWGEIKIIAGNKAYVDSIENAENMPEAFSKKFIPNSDYKNYFPHDTNFELFLYNSAVLKRPTHSYVHPDRFDLWFNLFSLPLDADEGNIHYCTYTQEITSEADPEQMSNVSQDTASEVLSTCIKLRATTDFEISINEVIQDIRNICGAGYCAILTMNELTQSCSLLCEDISEYFRNTTYKPGWFTEDFYKIASGWEAVIGGSNCLILKNLKEMDSLKEKDPQWYDSLVSANVESLVLFPLKNGRELVGYIWATNFDTDKTMHIKEVLELTTFFIASEISSYEMFDKFRILSTIDLLTGVYNRNEMNNRVMQLSVDNRPNRKNLGIVFADLNGLKQVNDNHGHSAGDKLIKDAAELLKEVFKTKEIFRAGGDEFMVLLRDTTMDYMEQHEKELKEKANASDKVRFAVGLCLMDDSQQIYEAMKAADLNMYEDKKKYYEMFPDQKRR